LKAWENLYDAVMSGTPAFERAHGANFFKYLAAYPADAAIFNAAMTAGSSIALSSIVESYDSLSSSESSMWEEVTALSSAESSPQIQSCAECWRISRKSSPARP